MNPQKKPCQKDCGACKTHYAGMIEEYYRPRRFSLGPERLPTYEEFYRVRHWGCGCEKPDHNIVLPEL